jgi:NlpC/P60 family/Bacterial dipeptidyl-peptidase Sh3 domain
VDAPRFAEGQKYSVSVGRAALRVEPHFTSAQDSELLFGETFTVYEKSDFLWGQAENDLYVGYLFEIEAQPFFKTDATVSALMAPVFLGPDLKTAVQDFLPLNARVPVLDRKGDYVQIKERGFIHQRHLEPSGVRDFVTIAERFVGVPYVWGGKTAAGLDCSGLVQTALQAVGKSAPRDTDMMEKALGEPVSAASQRGDLVFWKGHMGVMLDETRLLHANAHHMLVAIEPLAEAVARIEKIVGPVTSIRRL